MENKRIILQVQLRALNESPASVPGLELKIQNLLLLRQMQLLWGKSRPHLVQWNRLRHRHLLQPRSLEPTLLSTSPPRPPRPHWQPCLRAPSHTSLHSVHPWSLSCYLSIGEACPSPCICTLLPQGRTLWPGRSRPASPCALWPLRTRQGRAQRASMQLRASRPPGRQTPAPWRSNGCVQIQPWRAAPPKPRGQTLTLR